MRTKTCSSRFFSRGGKVHLQPRAARIPQFLSLVKKLCASSIKCVARPRPFALKPWNRPTDVLILSDGDASRGLRSCSDVRRLYAYAWGRWP